MRDVFAELMAYLFAENRRMHPMSAWHSNRMLSAVRSCVLNGSYRNDQREDEKNEG